MVRHIKYIINIPGEVFHSWTHHALKVSLQISFLVRIGKISDLETFWKMLFQFVEFSSISPVDHQHKFFILTHLGIFIVCLNMCRVCLFNSRYLFHPVTQHFKADNFFSSLRYGHTHCTSFILVSQLSQHNFICTKVSLEMSSWYSIALLFQVWCSESNVSISIFSFFFFILRAESFSSRAVACHIT